MTIEFGVALLGQMLAAIAVVALFALLAIWRRVTLPSILVLSKWVRPVMGVQPIQDTSDSYESLPKFRVWIQNMDSAPVAWANVVLRLPGRGFIRAVRAVGGGGSWEPHVVPPGQPSPVDRHPNDWIVYCPEGMRPHATWRIEVNVTEETSEIEVQMLRHTGRFGRADGDMSIGPALGRQPLALLLAVGISTAAFLWWLSTPEDWLPVLITVLLIGGWATVLFFLVRPAQAGIMSGWAGLGRGWKRSDNGATTRIND